MRHPPRGGRSRVSARSAGQTGARERQLDRAPTAWAPGQESTARPGRRAPSTSRAWSRAWASGRSSTGWRSELAPRRDRPQRRRPRGGGPHRAPPPPWTRSRPRRAPTPRRVPAWSASRSRPAAPRPGRPRLRRRRSRRASRPASAVRLFPPDIATCDDCLRELFDPADRRYRYPFINCTDCGPRATIIEELPYDRAQTTHARLPAVPGVRARVPRPGGPPLPRRARRLPGLRAAARLAPTGRRGTRPPRTRTRWRPRSTTCAAGRIVAIKGLGGYHLACLATDAAAVARLRDRKRRWAKPFAVMVRDLPAARRLARILPRGGGAADVSRAARSCWSRGRPATRLPALARRASPTATGASGCSCRTRRSTTCCSRRSTRPSCSPAATSPTSRSPPTTRTPWRASPASPTGSCPRPRASAPATTTPSRAWWAPGPRTSGNR